MSTQNVIYLLAAFSECTSPRVKGGGNGEKGQRQGRTQEISRSGAITFLMPRFRSGVLLGCGGSLQILTARERANESGTERVKTVGKREEGCSHSLACN